MAGRRWKEAYPFALLPGVYRSDPGRGKSRHRELASESPLPTLPAGYGVASVPHVVSRVLQTCLSDDQRRLTFAGLHAILDGVTRVSLNRKHFDSIMGALAAGLVPSSGGQLQSKKTTDLSDLAFPPTKVVEVSPFYAATESILLSHRFHNERVITELSVK